MILLNLFCSVDDFCQEYLPKWHQTLIASGEKRRVRASRLSVSEVMTIVIWFHQSGFKTFKAFYLHVQKFHRSDFPGLVSYNRFIELKKSCLVPLSDYLRSRFDQATGIAFIDSTKLAVCHSKRVNRNKVFKDVAKLGKSSMGWFYGFKLHVIINERGGLLAVKLTTGNTDDRQPVPEMVKGLFGKLFGDKGYLSAELTKALQAQGIQLITSIRKNMKPKMMTLFDKLMLRKRSVIETVNDQLKNQSQIEHSRHRSVENFAVNLLAGLIAYTHQEKKPSINFDCQDKQTLALMA